MLFDRHLERGHGASVRIDTEEDVAAIGLVIDEVAVGPPVGGEVDLATWAVHHLAVHLAVAPRAGGVIHIRKEVAQCGQGPGIRVVLVYERVSVGTDMVTDGGEEPSVRQSDSLPPHRPGVARVVGSRVDSALYLHPIDLAEVDHLGAGTADEGLSGRNITGLIDHGACRCVRGVGLLRRRRCGTRRIGGFDVGPRRFWGASGKLITSPQATGEGERQAPNDHKPFPRPHSMPSDPVFDDRLVEMHIVWPRRAVKLARVSSGGAYVHLGL